MATRATPAPRMQTTAETPTASYPLHEAAATGNADEADLLLLAGLDANTRNARSSTPLHLAAVKGHGNIAVILLAHGASANAANEGGNTPLHAAVEAGELEIAKLLLEVGAEADVSSVDGIKPLHIALQQRNAPMVSTLLANGATLDENLVQVTFGLAVELCEATEDDGTLPPEVPSLLHHVFDADFQQLEGRHRVTQNVTCLQPAQDAPKTRADHEPGYGVINDDLLAVPLREGRACQGGACCDECSRVTFSSLVTPAEADDFVEELEFVWPEDTGHQFSLSKCAFRDRRTSLIFVRFVERMRRAIAHEFGLPLATVAPLQTFVSCFEGAGAKQGGLHSDESTFKEFHYSCVLYLSTQLEDFEGGTFSWSDAPTVAGAPRVNTPLSPTKGAAVVFSSGWENMHEVDPLVSGKRFAVPAFFTTLPDGPPTDAGELYEPQAIADELWRSLLNPESADDPRTLIMKWHSIMAPSNP